MGPPVIVYYNIIVPSPAKNYKHRGSGFAENRAPISGS
jgi:hypothetical protein